MKISSYAKLAALIFASSSALHAATVFTDDGSNYSGGWATGSNGGSGFGAWTLTSSAGTGGFAGALIGDPSFAGIVGMSTTSFAPPPRLIRAAR